VAVREELNGAPDPRVIVNRRYTFDGNKMTMTRTIDGTFGKYEGLFEVDSKAGDFDFSGTGPKGNPVAFRGIYKLNGDSLTLCYKYVKEGTTRPTEFRTDDTAGTAFCLIVLRRERKQN
jgi:uncharacterized protein (TIGR03067 family)